MRDVAAMRWFPLLIPLALAACAKVLPKLHELGQYAGKLELQLPDRALAGELTFDRASRNLQWVVRGPTTVSLVRREDGNAQAFENGQPRAATELENADLRMIATLVDPGPMDGVEIAAAPGGYRFRRGSFDATVRLIETFKGHGGR